MSRKVLGMNKDLATILVPTIATIIVFLLGQFFVWMRDQKGKVADTEDYRLVIFKWIASCEESITKLSTAINSFIGEMSKSDNIMPERLEINVITIGKLKDIKIDRYVKTLIINSKKKKNICSNSKSNDRMVFNIISQIDYLYAASPSILETYDSYQKQVLTLQKEWNKNLDALKEAVHEETVLINDDTAHPQYKLQSKVLAVFNTWFQKVADGYSPLNITIKELVDPLFALIQTETKDGRSNQYTLKMFILIRNLLKVNNQWGISKPAYIKIFSDIANNIDASYSALMDSQKYFEVNTCVKSWWKVR